MSATMVTPQNGPALVRQPGPRPTEVPVSIKNPSPPPPRIPLSREMAQSDFLGKRSLLDRLWEKIDVRGSDECWPFTGATAQGYGRIGLPGRDSGTAPAHRVVALHYLPSPTPEQTQVRHLCGNRACCNPHHLAWGDQAANEADKVGHGLSNRGERHGLSKLTEADVREIRRRVGWGWTQRRIAETYGIAQQSVSEIVTGRTWGWLNAGGGDAV